MSKRFLLSIILVLILTNMITLLFWNQNDHKPGSDVIDHKGEKQITTNKPVATIEGEEISYEDWNKALQAE